MKRHDYATYFQPIANPWRYLSFDAPWPLVKAVLDILRTSFWFCEWADRDQLPYESGRILRSPAREAEWHEEMLRCQQVAARVESTLQQFNRGECSAELAAYVIEAATEELRRAMPTFETDWLDDRASSDSTPARRRGPEITHGTLQITAPMLAAISQASASHRWHVALFLLLNAAIHVVIKNRPSPSDIVAKARELAGVDLFPKGDVAEDLYRLAGIRLDRLTEKARGGGRRRKRSIQSVIDELRKRYEPALSVEDRVFDTIRGNPEIAGDEQIAKLLGIRRQRVTAARKALVAAGRVENRGTARRPRLFVPNAPSSPPPIG